MPTIREVAENAGVSASTASRILAGGDKRTLYSDATVARVEQAAEALGYRLNYHMRSVRTGRSNAIGFSMDAKRQTSSRQVGSWYFEQLREGIEARAQDAQMNLLTVRPDARRSAAARGLDYVQDRRLDALVVPRQRAQQLFEAARADPALPIVTVDGAASGVLSHVGFDEQAGQHLVVDHLLRLGHLQAIWFGPSFDGDDEGDRREQRFLREAFAAGLTGRVCLIPDIGEGGTAGLDAVLKDAQTHFSRWMAEEDPPRFTAVVCYNDLYAIGAQRALIRAGWRVPEDVTVIGFDDAFASFGEPPLTSVSHELFEMGQEACDLAIELVEARLAAGKSHLTPRTRTVQPRLIVRQSSGPAPSPPSSPP